MKRNQNQVSQKASTISHKNQPGTGRAGRPKGTGPTIETASPRPTSEAKHASDGMPSLAAKSNEHPVGLVLYDYRAGKPTIPVPLSAGEFSDLLKFGAKSGSAAEFIAGAIREKIAFDAFVRRNKGEIKPSFAYLALFQPGTGERMAVAGLSEAEVDGILEAAISKGWTPSRLLDRAILMATLSGSTINQPTAQPADT